MAVDDHVRAVVARPAERRAVHARAAVPRPVWFALFAPPGLQRAPSPRTRCALVRARLDRLGEGRRGRDGSALVETPRPPRLSRPHALAAAAFVRLAFPALPLTLALSLSRSFNSDFDPAPAAPRAQADAQDARARPRRDADPLDLARQRVARGQARRAQGPQDARRRGRARREEHRLHRVQAALGRLFPAQGASRASSCWPLSRISPQTIRRANA